MAVLLTGACISLYYFHVILRIGTIITHIFYIPIILASIWWKRKGLLVALFASGLLVLSHVFLRPDVANHNDYFRAFMFVVTAFVVAELSRRIAKEHEALQAANQQLSAAEQQLRAANQQLKASNQQLRTNEQRLVSEIAERKQIEERIREQREFLRNTIESLGHPFYVIDANDKTVKMANSTAWQGKLPEKITCYMLSHKQNKPCSGADHPCPFEDIKKTKQPVIVEHIHYDKDANPRNVEVHACPIFDNEQNVTQIIEYCLDITERKKAEEVLRAANQQLIASEQQLRASNQQLMASEQQLKAANQQLIASQEEIQSLANFPSENSNPVLRIAKDGIVLYSNEAAIPLLTEWGTQMGRRLPDKWRKFAADVFGSGSSKETECDYDDHVLSLTFAPVVDLGYVNVYGLEITERKRAEQHLKTSLEEKEVLMREIHHRVKNNLQIIVSLLSLQSEYVKDKQAVELFRQSQFRVKSMALLHERLYETEDLAHINFSDYIRDMTNELLFSYGPDAGNIKLKINVKDVFPSVDVAVPCALIINELVTNCLKHAFPRSKAGEIRIELNLDEQGSYTLLVSDDGVGFAKDVDFPDGRTLGLQLVSTLAEQLRASVVLDKSAGTSFKISFSKPQ